MKKSYYAIIPANVRYDSRIRPNAKLLYGEITALCNEKGYCWAGNQYFADLYGVSKVSISLWIKDLIDNGYLYSHIEYKEGTKEILNRYLSLVNDPIKEKLNTPIKEKLKGNTTVINNTFNKENSSKQVSSNTLSEDFEKLWKLYPKKTGKKKAFTSYKRVIKKGVTNKEIQTGIVKYKRYLSQNEWLQPADGSTWFNNERWEDEFQIENDQQTPSKYDNTNWEEKLKQEGLM
ncbi:helix-turn-helix domain-containing protein [Marinilactibacillus psychrotolerans]|uniref:helix-turn-helix domain-containing protein n=1 Tax=Marinilactibacillus psychrotolerans TaxID=191770 RepID=UPI003889C56A